MIESGFKNQDPNFWEYSSDDSSFEDDEEEKSSVSKTKEKNKDQWPTVPLLDMKDKTPPVRSPAKD